MQASEDESSRNGYTKQHNWNVNMIPSLTVSSLDFPGDAHPNSNPNARLGRTLENRSKDASLDVAHDEKARKKSNAKQKWQRRCLWKATASGSKASEDDKRQPFTTLITRLSLSSMRG